ncbi:MAG TPA: methyl-accepting chemotaxis protein [Gallionella sp.]|nr:methyl-accepting chemotaxis protein [Gallionella sp.]
MFATLKHRFILLGATSCALFLSATGFGLLQLHNEVRGSEDSLAFVHASIDAMGHVDSMNVAFLKEVKLAKDVWIRGANPEKLAKYRGEFVEQAGQFEKDRLAAMDVLKAAAAGKADFGGYVSRLEALGAEHRALSGKYLAQIDAHVSTADSDAKVAGIDRALTQQVAELRDDFAKFVENDSREKIELSQRDYQQHRNALIAWSSAALLISAWFGYAVIRRVLRQLGGDPGEVSAVLHEMAAGNFSIRNGVAQVPGSLMESACEMQSRLREMIASTKNSAQSLTDMAHSLAASATQISQSVKAESGAVAGMASAIEEMSASTSHISEQGDGAKEIATRSRRNAEEGAAVINRTVSGLLVTAQEIEEASREVSHLGEDASRISEVVRVIREIADQTNLLALNAAIEAARAGEQGRGFAVVADEVRKLAERTSNATAEINQMSAKIGAVAEHALTGMDKVVQTTREGVADAETAQASIAHIQQSFNEVSSVIDEISDALAQQNSAASELAGSTEHISRLSEENAGSSQGLLKLAQALDDSANRLKEAVSVFRV